MKSAPAIIFAIIVGCVSVNSAQESVDFNREIKPILAENCFACHGIDAEARTADLRLDVRDAAIDSGAIVPGEPDDSSLVERILSDDKDFVMPPSDTNKSLTAEQKELLKRWVAEGAVYQSHWSLITPEKSLPPAVKNEGWIRNEIDSFVLARLEKENLAPAAEADAQTLFRRLNLDITGLPPSPTDSISFATDFEARGDAAVSDWIDRLMDRPSWGEHRARYWLDAARYADTHGMHFDNYREIWPYRDWVIRAFNSNQRFDQFTLEQLAGDLLDHPTLDQLVATGFQRCNMTTNEGGTIDEENMMLYATDRVQTFGWVYLGLTTNCCQCHDHKFDPISMKDYYSLAAFFRNTTQQAKDGNVKDGLGPVITLPSNVDAERWNKLPEEIATTKTQRDTRRTDAVVDFEKWLDSVDVASLDAAPIEGLIMHVPLNEGAGNEVKSKLPAKGKTEPIATEAVNPSLTSVASATPVTADVSREEVVFRATADLKWDKDGVIGPAARLTKASTIELGDYANFTVDQAYSVGCWVKATEKRGGAIVARMDNNASYRGWDVWQDSGEFAAHLIDKWTENGLKVVTKGSRVRPGTWQHVFVTWDGSGKASGLKIFIDGKLADSSAATDTLKEGADSRIDTPLRIGRRSTGEYPFEGFVQDLYVYERKLEPTEIANIVESGPLQAALSIPREERTEESVKSLQEHYLRNHDGQFMELETKYNALVAELDTIKNRSPVTHVQIEKQTPAMANILLRGAYDKVGDEVSAAPPSALHPMPPGAPPNRLGLAQWVVDPANPLTARVTVNRCWQELFGTGIVATSEDFGVMGTPPTNQDLLDWLAVDFRESGWDLKRLYKMMLSSSTYRQASVTTAEKLEKDRDNSWFSRGPRFRMDAEMVRDYALAASGLLTDRLYGPGARPYQPDHIWDIVGLPGSDTRNYVQDKGEDVYRRSLYSFWKRMSPPPNLEAFNAPSREVCAVRRERTNTPLQALVTLNDPQFFEAARVLAQHAMKGAEGNVAQTLNFIASRAVCRTFSEREIAIITESRVVYLKHYQDHPEDAKALVAFGQAPVEKDLDVAELAAWTMICNEILNLDEVLTK